MAMTSERHEEQEGNNENEMAHRQMPTIGINRKISTPPSCIRRFRPADWARVVALLTMVHGFLFFAGGTFILLIRSLGYEFHLNQIFFVLVGMAMAAGEMINGRHLAIGINEQNHLKLLDWIVFTLCFQVGPFLALILLLLMDPILNIEWGFNIFGSVLPVILYCICVYIVNNYRKELQRLEAQERAEGMEMNVM